MGLLTLAVAILPAQELASIVTGRVVDETGAPLPGVVICSLRVEDLFLTADLAKGTTVTTDGDGHWHWARPKPEVIASQRLLFVMKGRVHVAVPWSAAEFPVVLPRGRTLVGRVVDATGKPLAGVRVEQRDALSRMPYRAKASRVAWPGEPLTAVRTDDAGRFVMPGTVDAGLQLFVGNAQGRAYGPFAHGDAIEIVHTTTGDVPANERATGFIMRPERREQAPTFVNGTTLGRLPIHGAGLCFWSDAYREIEGTARVSYGERTDYGTVRPIAADGTFRFLKRPGTYFVKLLLPRPLQQGQPDVCDMGTVEVTEATETLELDLRPYLPSQVVGRVRSPAPSGRLLVGVAVYRGVGPYRIGFASYASPLAPVAPDGSFAVQTPPGTCTIFVIDQLTGLVLHRQAPCEIGPSTRLDVGLDVAAGAVEVALAGPSQRVRWLEVMAPKECFPDDIDDQIFTAQRFTRRIGCFLENTATCRTLWLPPTAAAVWLCDAPGGELEPAARAEFVIEAGKTKAVSLRSP